MAKLDAQAGLADPDKNAAAVQAAAAVVGKPKTHEYYPDSYTSRTTCRTSQ